MTVDRPRCLRHGMGRHRLPPPVRVQRGHRHRLAAVAVVAAVMALIPAGLAETRIPPLVGPATAQAAEVGETPILPTLKTGPARPAGGFKARSEGSSAGATPYVAPEATTQAPAPPAVEAAPTTRTTAPTTPPATRPAQSRAPWPPNCGATT